ncbi:hypothetical protein PEC18_08965 [Paucibacter sp. O1-1]|nr:hypothetical protein [Paucibacter sp. O1-1]MDA3825988.1 hypothetical protein [Paucibacter sp. O1-1]
MDVVDRVEVVRGRIAFEERSGTVCISMANGAAGIAIAHIESAAATTGCENAGGLHNTLISQLCIERLGEQLTG